MSITTASRKGKGRRLQNYIVEYLYKKYPTLDENLGLSHFTLLVDTMNSNGYEQYEISNYAKDGVISRHNSNYWRNAPYIGIGPSAHSFNLTSRQWNSSTINKYIDNIDMGLNYSEKEELSIIDRYNEFVMLGLRTSWGVNISDLDKLFGKKYKGYFLSKLKSKKVKDFIIANNNSFVLSKKGKYLADGIASELFI